MSPLVLGDSMNLFQVGGLAMPKAFNILQEVPEANP